MYGAARGGFRGLSPVVACRVIAGMAEKPESLSSWEVLRRQPHADCRVFTVSRNTCRHPTLGKEADFFIIESVPWVNVLAITPEKKMVLVRQYRFGIEGFSLEIPGGMADGKEDPVTAGVRELREETGYVGRNARQIGMVHPNPAIQNNTCHLVLVEDARREAEIEWDHHEEMETVLMDVEAVFELARSGGITHSLVIDAFFFFLPYWEKMKK